MVLFVKLVFDTQKGVACINHDPVQSDELLFYPSFVMAQG